MRYKTFYISGSSNIIPEVKALGASLIELGLGLSWHYDWTLNYGGGDQNDIREQDIQAAAHADLFVFLDSPHFSKGGMMEYGVRLFTGYVHHIGCVDRSYMFFGGYRVKHYTNVKEFLDATHQF